MAEVVVENVVCTLLPAADSIDEVDEAVDESAVAVLWAVLEDFTVTEIVEEACVVVALAVAVDVGDDDDDDEVLNPSPPVTPALSVGSVTESAGDTVEASTADVVFAFVLVDTLANVGHKAP